MTAASAPPSHALLSSLEALGPLPALAWYGEASRIELSGHVLANWVIKAIGHLHDEVALEPGDTVVLDLAPHWKRLVLALAAWSLGGQVVVGSDEVEEPRVVITDRPDSALAGAADEVLAVQPVSLAPRYDGELPPLVRDWLVEVRASSDRLDVPLPGWSGPTPAPSAAGTRDGTADGAGGGSAERTADGTTGRAPGASAPRLLVGDDGIADAPLVLATFLAGGGIVGPAAAVAPERAEAEGVTGEA